MRGASFRRSLGFGAAVLVLLAAAVGGGLALQAASPDVVAWFRAEPTEGLQLLQEDRAARNRAADQVASRDFAPKRGRTGRHIPLVRRGGKGDGLPVRSRRPRNVGNVQRARRRLAPVSERGAPRVRVQTIESQGDNTQEGMLPPPSLPSTGGAANGRGAVGRARPVEGVTDGKGGANPSVGGVRVSAGNGSPATGGAQAPAGNGSGGAQAPAP